MFRSGFIITSLTVSFCFKLYSGTGSVSASLTTTGLSQAHMLLSELCIPVSTSAGRYFLLSATYGDLLVPWTSTSTYGPNSFAVSGPSVWNKLPATLRVSPTLGQFQSKLKAVLSRSAYET